MLKILQEPGPVFLSLLFLMSNTCYNFAHCHSIDIENEIKIKYK